MTASAEWLLEQITKLLQGRMSDDGQSGNLHVAVGDVTATIEGQPIDVNATIEGQPINVNVTGGTVEAALDVPVDPIVGFLVTIDAVHSEVHEGNLYTVSYSASVLNGNNLDIRITTGAKYAHLDFAIFSTGQVTVSLFEAPTVSSGTALAAYNNSRSSANSAATVFAHTPTVTATGSTALINGIPLPGGASPTTRAGATLNPRAEFILKPSTEYLLRVNNSSGSTILIGTMIQFYEES